MSEPIIAKIIVSERGPNIFPSTPCSEKRGRKTSTMIRMEKVMGLATSRSACPIRARRSGLSVRLQCRMMFSLTTMDPSTTMPMATASPPRLIRLAVTPAASMKIKAISAVMGRLKAATSAVRSRPITRIRTRITKRPPCSRAPDTVPMTERTRSVRS